MRAPLSYITVLRLPLAVGVVFIHAQQGPLPQGLPPMHMDMVAQLRWWLSSALPSLAVATFFILSGFLFFQGYSQQEGWHFFRRKWSNRLRTLLLPYLLWNVLKLLQLWAKHDWDAWSTHWQRVEGFNFLWGQHTIGRATDGFLGLSLGSFDAPLNVPLWFVRELMIFSLLTPLLAFLLRHRWSALSLLALLFGLYALYALPYPLGISLRSLPMFALGAAIALHGGDLYAPLHRWRWWLYASWSALLLLQWSGHSSRPLVLLSTATGIATYLALAGHIAWRMGTLPRWYVQLSRGSFLVYVAHTVGILGSSIWLVKQCCAGTSMLERSVAYVLPPLLTVAVCLLAALLFARYLPRLSAPFTGIWGKSSSAKS